VRPPRAHAAALAVGVLAGACRRDAPVAGADASAVPVARASASAGVVAEALPRCRPEGARLALPGDDIVVGDALATADALFVGVVRRDGKRRVASMVRTSLDLTTSKVTDLGSALGDDPPPSPRLANGVPVALYYARKSVAPSDAGAGRMADRFLELARLDGASPKVEARITQQGDESLAYDVAWPDAPSGSALVAWDEDAPLLPTQLFATRGVVKVQLAAEGSKPRIASPEGSDAESPRLFARRGGYWLAWLARRAETTEDAGVAPEAPGERRAYRWVEIVSLDANGEAVSPVRRVSPEKGHVAAFELVNAESAGDVVVLVQDEAARAEGAGERLVRYAVSPERIEASDVLADGVGHALAELVSVTAGSSRAPRWLAWADVHEHAHLASLGPGARVAAGAATTEPALDGTRLVAAAAPDVVFAATGSELRRVVCR